MINNKKFRKNLAELKGKASNVEFAKKCGLNEASIRGWLKGNSEPTLSKINQIAQACNIRVGWLAAGEEPKELNRAVLQDDETMEFLENIVEGRYPTLEDVTTAARETKGKIIQIRPEAEIPQTQQSVSDGVAEQMNDFVSYLGRRSILLIAHLAKHFPPYYEFIEESAMPKAGLKTEADPQEEVEPGKDIANGVSLKNERR